jgi:excisionase family DNA binding protein
LAWFRRRFEGEFAEPQREREVSMAEAQPKTGATSTNLGSEPESPTVPTAASESTRTEEGEPLLTAGEVATMFRIDPKAVTRWVKSGKLTPIRTLGGHRRYREAEVRELLKGTPPERSE